MGQYCRSHGISVTAYNSVRRTCGRAEGAATCNIADNVQKVAATHQITEVQVLLRWAVDHGISVIPGCTSREHIKEALQVAGAGPLVEEDVASIGKTTNMTSETTIFENE